LVSEKDEKGSMPMHGALFSLKFQRSARRRAQRYSAIFLVVCLAGNSISDLIGYIQLHQTAESPPQNGCRLRHIDLGIWI
jgi:hypothetical protein